MSELKFLTNAHKEITSDTVIRYFGESVEDAISNQKKYRSGKIVGRPKSTAHFTTEQLEKMGLIGIYTKEPTP